MASDTPGDVTLLLQEWERGNAQARERLIELVYDQLHRLARAQLRREHAARTLGPTALVNEAYLRLVGQEGLAWKDRGHFYAIAAVTMRRVLVEAARRRGAAKRGGDWRRVTLGAELQALEARGVDLLDLDGALEALAVLDPRQARIVELRYFVELSIEETADALGLSPATVKREWNVARAWLFRHLEGDTARPPGAEARG
jgi:RNA polymerase sigma factor (TIGR02999 family)